MKSFVVSCGIFVLVIGLLIGNAVFVLRCADTMMAAAQQLPKKTHGDPAEYGAAVQTLHSIWEKNRDRIAVTVPRRVTEPLERSMRALEAGWYGRDDAMYRQAVSDLLGALSNLRETEGFSLGAIV